jgi:tetratricopeptide (TPR) repeat protein
MQAAHTAAQRLLEQCLAAGDAAYQGTAYDIAIAHFLLGKTLESLGAAEAALQPLTEAQPRFKALAASGDAAASFMASVATMECGHCLADLGQLNKAAAAYEDTIQRAKQRDHQRIIATGKNALGTVRMLQQRYEEALAAHQEALQIFDTIDEPGAVARTWHRIGMVCHDAQQFAQAEQAYRQALAMMVQQLDRFGEASILGMLGSLYIVMRRPQEAVAFYRQAADIYVALGNLGREGIVRNNLAFALMILKLYDDARQELQRAIECQKPFGNAAELWKPLRLLHKLEQDTGNAPAAADAWQQAVQCYLAYRRAGGESQKPGARLYAQITHAIRQGDTTEATQFLAQAAAAADTPDWLKVMLPKLQAILHGDRDSALAVDPALDYDDAAELLLLLETLGAGDMESKE